jgi:hypothetical protein
MQKKEVASRLLLHVRLKKKPGNGGVLSGNFTSPLRFQA